MRRDSVKQTLLVATTLCVVCSVIVSITAVGLRARQEANKRRERQVNILKLVRMYEPGVPVEEQFQHVDTRIVNLETGEFAKDVDPKGFDQRKAAKNPKQNVTIDSEQDVAGIRQRSKYAFLYIVRKPDGSVDQLVFPVHGKGLWSTLYGYLALDADLTTIRGLTFYEDKETPGLGGEINNPKWQAEWAGKQAFGDEGGVKIHVVHGLVEPGDPDGMYMVDGLSGATFTSRGVTNLLKYWLGPDGFGPFLSKLREQPTRLAQRPS